MPDAADIVYSRIACSQLGAGAPSRGRHRQA
jgi:hypothetical protein